MQNGLNQLKDTQNVLHRLSATVNVNKAEKVGSIAKQLGIEMNGQDASKLGSNELIAHTMAERVLAQVSSGKAQSQVAEDLEKTKGAWQLAHRAYYDKDPEAIAYLQLDNDDDEDEQIILEVDEQA